MLSPYQTMNEFRSSFSSTQQAVHAVDPSQAFAWSFHNHILLMNMSTQLSNRMKIIFWCRLRSTDDLLTIQAFAWRNCGKIWKTCHDSWCSRWNLNQAHLVAYCCTQHSQIYVSEEMCMENVTDWETDTNFITHCCNSWNKTEIILFTCNSFEYYYKSWWTPYSYTAVSSINHALEHNTSGYVTNTNCSTVNMGKMYHKKFK
jgi:hypothetical protein